MSGLKWMVFSRGVVGPVVALVSMALMAAGVEFSADDQRIVVDSWTATVQGMVTLAGVVLGLVGRIRARKTLTALPPELSGGNPQ